MAGSVRLVLTFHNHQPVGNFDGVFEQAYRDSYLPFLDVMQDYPEIPFGLHTSGSLLEWLERHRPEYIERLRRMVGASQVEIIGGAFYEPILANIPRRDRIEIRYVAGANLETRSLTCIAGLPQGGMAHWSLINRTIVCNSARRYIHNHFSMPSDDQTIAISYFANHSRGDIPFTADFEEFIDVFRLHDGAHALLGFAHQDLLRRK